MTTEKKILIEANGAAIEMSHAVLEYIIPRLRKSTAHTNCDAENLAGLAQQYIKTYSGE